MARHFMVAACFRVSLIYKRPEVWIFLRCFGFRDQISSISQNVWEGKEGQRAFPKARLSIETLEHARKTAR